LLAPRLHRLTSHILLACHRLTTHRSRFRLGLTGHAPTLLHHIHLPPDVCLPFLFGKFSQRHAVLAQPLPLFRLKLRLGTFAYSLYG
jgi:hypothetical protein